ncbi:Oligopeptide transport system permease protein OppB [Methanosarcina horonobensis HB-1 = JCM 15518]|uniref:Nickel import system ATP-binding protein NikD n=2 Tax=Methanosarcina horonobensis TaxID=418008 RepID=A0A0E3SCV8_9EURY|nr:ABC transporter ATP-binding protein [Methanosarcina horonobensis]AKB77173.1 Oligopeptide transport system permease protein OppB [Methanosarcina horonobensis HB-1 = JCM 15518]
MDTLSHDFTGETGREPILRIRKLNTTFITGNGPVRAVNGLDFDLKEKERMAIIGESGCGKSVLAQTILKLLPQNALVSGEIVFHNRDLLRTGKDHMVKIRGGEIGLIPQHISSLDPLMKIKGQVQKAIHPNGGSQDKRQLYRKVFDLLNSVGLYPHVSDRYPHQLSGGMNRRVLISMGIAQNPDLLIADEPTTGLDTILRNKTVKLIDSITAERSLLLITHDIGAARICENLAVMYAGEIIERGPAQDMLDDPRHPYTQGLMSSMPSKGMSSIPGMSPSLIQLPTGCRFHPRCPYAKEKCATHHPDMREENRGVRCHYACS